MIGVVIRAAATADHEAIHRLERLMGAEAWSGTALDEELGDPDRLVLVAELDGGVVGWALTRVAGDVADLLRVGVAAGHRRRGVATHLLSSSLDAAVAAGAEQVLLEVSVANVPALAAYRNAGFAEIHRRPRYYRDGTDALVLQWTPR